MFFELADRWKNVATRAVQLGLVQQHGVTLHKQAPALLFTSHLFKKLSIDCVQRRILDVNNFQLLTVRSNDDSDVVCYDLHLQQQMRMSPRYIMQVQKRRLFPHLK